MSARVQFFMTDPCTFTLNMFVQSAESTSPFAAES